MSCAALLLMAGCTTGLEDLRQNASSDAPLINIDLLNFQIQNSLK